MLTSLFCRSYRWLHALMNALLLTPCLLASGKVLAAPSDLPGVLMQAGLDAHSVQASHSHGVYMEMAAFVSSHSLTQVAARLSASGRFEHVLSLPGQLWLSGMYQGSHWLAVLQRYSRQTRGQISMMAPMDPTEQARRARPELDLIQQGMPATPLLDHYHDDVGQTVHQQAWLVPWHLDKLASEFARHLQRQGAKRLSQTPSQGRQLSTWLWHGQELNVLMARHGTDTVLFIQVLKPSHG